MEKRGKRLEGVSRTVRSSRKAKAPKSLALIERGIGSGASFSAAMTALLGDVVAGRVSVQVATVGCKITNQLLRLAELQRKARLTRPAPKTKMLEA